jgi:hypothetical protein
MYVYIELVTWAEVCTNPEGLGPVVSTQVSLEFVCLEANDDIVPKFSTMLCMLLTHASRFKFITIKIVYCKDQRIMSQIMQFIVNTEK